MSTKVDVLVVLISSVVEGEVKENQRVATYVDYIFVEREMERKKVQEEYDGVMRILACVGRFQQGRGITKRSEERIYKSGRSEFPVPPTDRIITLIRHTLWSDHHYSSLRLHLNRQHNSDLIYLAFCPIRSER